MTQTTALRKELQSYIADMPEQRLLALRPLLYELSLDTPFLPADSQNAPLYRATQFPAKQPMPRASCEATSVIEAASEEETRMAEERIEEWRQDPSCFVPLESVAL